MPSVPNLDGLPLGIQITITVMFGLAALLVAGRGYFKGSSTAGAAMVMGNEKSIQQVQTAALVDMATVRNLTDACNSLSSNIENLEKTIRDGTYWTRASHELSRETCARLRELNETLERSDARR